MRQRGQVAAAVTFLVLAWALPAPAQDVPQFAVASWYGVAFPSSGNAPAGCSALSEFSTGDRVEILLNTGMMLGLHISKGPRLPEWVPSNQTGGVRAWVDDEPEFAFAGRVTPTGLFLDVGSVLNRSGASTFRRLGEGRALNVVVDGTLQRYALRGTYGALAELIGCAQKVRAGEVTFPARATPPLAAAPPPQSAQAAQRPPSPAPAASDESRVTGSGSGVVVSDAGHILTADHVIESCRSLKVIQIGASAVAADVVGRDSRNDLALLRVATPLPNVASLRLEALRNGEAVVAFGYPLGGLLASTGNVTFGNVSALVGLRDDSRMLQISAPVQPGNSGGPLLDMGGRLVGVVQSKLNAVNVAVASGDIPQNVNFAMKGSVALGFLQAHNVEPVMERRGPDLSQADVTAQAQKVTVRVLCLGAAS
ncbi:S1C family serine protease [Muricoccus aerilatus]|uniref:S1C family serine protease n=1 Tax=Muricoccus aerilatus TaxID=452982 RepID=UPI000B081DB0|nr:serine protease [Roseomonas aerilata]